MLRESMHVCVCEKNSYCLLYYWQGLTVIIDDIDSGLVQTNVDSWLGGFRDIESEELHTFSSNDIIDDDTRETGPVVIWLNGDQPQ